MDQKTAKLSLEGKIVKDCVPDLKKLLLRYRDRENKSVVLDFAGVTFIDDSAVRMLEKIKDDRTKIINCSLFIKTLLSNSIASNSEQN